MSSSQTSAQCGVCGVIGLPAEMHRNSLPVPGTLPTTPNSVTYRCRDDTSRVSFGDDPPGPGQSHRRTD